MNEPNYVLSLSLNDGNEIDGDKIIELAELLGDSLFCILTISNRTRPFNVGDWAYCIDECIMFDGNIGSWVNQVTADFKAHDVDVCWCEDDVETQVDNTPCSLGSFNL